MKYNYFATMYAEEHGGKTMLCASVIRLGSHQDVLHGLDVPNITNALLCETKKRAYEIVRHWNQSFDENGTYMFSKENQLIIDRERYGSK